MRYVFLVVAVIGVLAMIAAYFDAGLQMNQAVVDFCRDEPERVEETLAEADGVGLIIGVGEAEIEVNDLIWAALPREQRVVIALAAWCQYSVLAYGSRSLIVRGWADGTVKASVLEGHFVE
jgi:hypothetical protein